MKKNKQLSKFKKKIIPNHFQSKYEENYFKSVQEADGLFNPKKLVEKYLILEQDNERLQRLRHKFGDENNASHLKSIHQSMVYENEGNRPALNPDYHVIKKGEFYSTKNTIQQREKNGRVQNKLKRFESPRQQFFTSQITTLPGPKNNSKSGNCVSNSLRSTEQSTRSYRSRDMDNISTVSSNISRVRGRREPMKQ